MTNNPTAPRVPINLGGQTYRLVLDWNAVATFEEMTGKNVLEGEMDSVNAREMRTFLWAALQAEHPDLTIEEVGSMIHFGNIEYVGKKFTELYSKHLPEPSEEEGPLVTEPATASAAESTG